MEMLVSILTLIVVVTTAVVIVMLNKEKPSGKKEGFYMRNMLAKPIDVWNVTTGTRDMIVPRKSLALTKFNSGDELMFTINGKEVFPRYTIGASQTITPILIGSIHTKYTPDSSPYVPIKDMAKIYIHNMTKIPLKFNGYIIVPPLSKISYEGPERNGIVTGFVLKEDSGLFQPLVLHDIVSDVYIGMVSSDPIHNGGTI